MTKFAFSTRQKMGEKETAKQGRKAKGKKVNDKAGAKKRRRR